MMAESYPKHGAEASIGQQKLVSSKTFVCHARVCSIAQRRIVKSYPSNTNHFFMRIKQVGSHEIPEQIPWTRLFFLSTNNESILTQGITISIKKFCIFPKSSHLFFHGGQFACKNTSPVTGWYQYRQTCKYFANGNFYFFVLGNFTILGFIRLSNSCNLIYCSSFCQQVVSNLQNFSLMTKSASKRKAFAWKITSRTFSLLPLALLTHFNFSVLSNCDSNGIFHKFHRGFAQRNPRNVFFCHTRRTRTQNHELWAKPTEMSHFLMGSHKETKTPKWNIKATLQWLILETATSRDFDRQTG